MAKYRSLHALRHQEKRLTHRRQPRYGTARIHCVTFIRKRIAAPDPPADGASTDRTVYARRASRIQPRRRSSTNAPSTEPDIKSVAHPSFDDAGRVSAPTIDMYAQSPLGESES